MGKLDRWIVDKFADIAAKLPTLVHTEPASFSCGYNTGYKQCLLDIERFFEELISGVMLLEHEYLNDTFIIWRSLLETTTTLLILIENPQLIGRFDERRKLALMRLKIIKTPPGGLDAKSMETKTHLGIKNVARRVFCGVLLPASTWMITLRAKGAFSSR